VRRACVALTNSHDFYIPISGIDWKEPERRFRLTTGKPSYFGTSPEYDGCDSFVVDNSFYSPRLDHSTGSAANMSLLSGWLGNCISNHEACRLEAQTMPNLPSRVIDPSEPCNPFLTETSGEQGYYLTLSYCWGSSKRILTTLILGRALQKNSSPFTTANRRVSRHVCSWIQISLDRCLVHNSGTQILRAHCPIPDCFMSWQVTDPWWLLNAGLRSIPGLQRLKNILQLLLIP
jgi:hypothetical protein